MMDPVQSEEKAKLRREKSRQAIALALQGKWERATEVNQRILGLFPEDVEALNRLGKASLELGQYSEARRAFECAAKIAPYNAISKKNLERLTHLQEAEPPPKQGRVVTPCLFIEESGKSGITVLQEPAPRQMLAKMASGDGVKLEPRDHALVIENNQGEHLGKVEPKMAMRLMRLMKGGNGYDAAIISINRQEVSLIIWETFRHPDLANECSFPTRSKDDYRVYWRDSLLRYDIDSELEEDDDPASEWMQIYPSGSQNPNGQGLSDDEEASDSPYIGNPGGSTPDDDAV